MSNLKDTDIDDLLRRASDDYPLRTDSSNWDRMAAALEEDPNPDPAYIFATQDNRRSRRFLWLFLLLPLAGAGYYTWHQSGHGTFANGHKNVATKNVATDNGTRPDNGTHTDNGTRTDNAPAAGQSNGAGNNGAPAATTPAATNHNNGAGATTPATDANIAPNQPANRPSVTHNNPATVKSTTPVTSTNSATTSTISAHPLTATAGNNRSTSTTPARSTRAVGHDRFAAGRTTYPDATNTANTNPANANRQTPSTPIASAFTLRYSDIDQQRARIAGAWNLSVDVKAPAIQKDTTKKKASPKAKTSYFYAGILGAPDFSTVKFQKTKGAGATFGILIGYAFNDRWSIETGAYLDKKRYYTDGEYFSKDKINLPTNIDLLNVDGACYMWEIPLNVRYTFNQGAKTRWFATAGLSTYLMNRENYSYAAKYYNGTQTWTSTKDLKTPSQYPFSIIGLSAGFEQRLGKLGNLRVEPYVRIPLGGIGTGSLPIMSAGVNVGITRRLW
ncbi:MAG TPA: outer membrane beta-barrel protein [Puia sp.]|nr:outer membrane beta-barrel protein [Puia sp.]